MSPYGSPTINNQYQRGTNTFLLPYFNFVSFLVIKDFEKMQNLKSK